MCDFLLFEKINQNFSSQNILKPQSQHHIQNHNQPQNIYFLNYQQFKEQGKLVVIPSRNSGLSFCQPNEKQQMR